MLEIVALAPALTNTPAMEPAFTSTIVSTYADGREAKLWLDADGTYHGQGRRGDPSNGRWLLKHDKLCFRQSRPIPIPFSWCTPMLEPKVGASWPGKSVTGEPIRIELRAGR